MRLPGFAVPMHEDASMSSDAAIDAAEEKAGLKNPGYEIFIGLLSILSIFNLVLLVIVTSHMIPLLSLDSKSLVDE